MLYFTLSLSPSSLTPSLSSSLPPSPSPPPPFSHPYHSALHQTFPWCSWPPQCLGTPVSRSLQAQEDSRLTRTCSFLDLQGWTPSCLHCPFRWASGRRCGRSSHQVPGGLHETSQAGLKGGEREREREKNKESKHISKKFRDTPRCLEPGELHVGARVLDS